MAPADVKWVAISHTHQDHVGNVDMFQGATVLMQKAEWDYATGEGAKDMDPELMKALQQQPR